MRYYNVYFYSSCPVELNVENFPSYWIWKIEKASQNDPIPENATRMSLNQIHQYKQQNKTAFNNWVRSKTDMYAPVDKKVKKAIKSVNDLINRFCSENIVLGITQQGKTKLIADTFKDVFYYAQTGSLYECLSALNAIVITQEMAPFITEERINNIKTQINDVLNNL